VRLIAAKPRYCWSRERSRSLQRGRFALMARTWRASSDWLIGLSPELPTGVACLPWLDPLIRPASPSSRGKPRVVNDPTTTAALVLR
jgi:hypothetical protein